MSKNVTPVIDEQEAEAAKALIDLAESLLRKARVAIGKAQGGDRQHGSIVRLTREESLAAPGVIGWLESIVPGLKFTTDHGVTECTYYAPVAAG